jgi:hypothetical protein
LLAPFWTADCISLKKGTLYVIVQPVTKRRLRSGWQAFLMTTALDA